MRTHHRATLLAGLALTIAAAAHAGRMSVVVPAYQYPTLGTLWSDLAAAAARVPVVAILDPANGPGTATDPNYADAVGTLRAAGGRVYGYVYTHYAARGADTVLADAARYPALYAVDGLFVDEVTADADPAHLAYYTALVANLHAALPGLPVMGNPGLDCDSAYVTLAHFDALVTFEHHAGYESWSPAAWMGYQSPSRFVNLVYARPTAGGMLDAVRQAAQRNVGGVFVTDDSLPNPWDRTPAYWPAEVAAIETTAVAPSALAVPPAFGARFGVLNPARGSVRFALPAASHGCRLALLDPQGRLVRTLDAAPGAATLVWDGRDANGRPARAGVYFARLTTDPGRALRFTLLR
jgi:hypothetical protein